MSETHIKSDIKTQLDRMKKKGHLNKAVELCQSAIKSDPTNPDLHIRLGDLYLEWHLDINQAKYYIDDAITEYQRALEFNINSALIHYKIGLVLYYKGELDKAASHLNISLQHNDKMSESYYILSKIYILKGRYTEAGEYAQQSIKTGGLKTARAHFIIHFILNAKTNLSFRQKTKANWNFLIGLLKLTFDKTAQRDIFIKLSNLKFLPIFMKGYYLEKSKSVYEAIDLYTEAIEKHPGFLPFYILLGDVYRSLGKVNDAINEYKMALWVSPNNPAPYKVLCSIYEEIGDYESAINMYQKLIQMNPNDAVLHSSVASLYYTIGNYEAAISAYQAAITLNPCKNWTSIIAQTLGYVLHETRQNYDAAISAYQSASMLNPYDIDIYINLGSTFYEKGEYDNAMSVYRLALEIDPNNARIHCNLGYILWGKGYIDEALKEYEISIKLDPSYDIAYNNLGVIFLDDLGHVQKSITTFEKAIENNPNYALAYYNLARAMSIKGNKIEAARLYQLALDMNSYTNELDNNEIKNRIDNLFK